MPVITAPPEYDEDDLYVDLWSIVGHPVALECEGFNVAGSIKLKAAAEMVEGAERDGLLRPGSVLVESSSGNLGVALAMLAVSKGYGFVCVTDHRCNLATRRMIEAFGGRVDVISEPDPVTGLLGARIEYVRTGPAIARRFSELEERYHDTVHQTNWLEALYGAEVLESVLDPVLDPVESL